MPTAPNLERIYLATHQGSAGANPQHGKLPRWNLPNSQNMRLVLSDYSVDIVKVACCQDRFDVVPNFVPIRLTLVASCRLPPMMSEFLLQLPTAPYSSPL